MPIVEKPLHSLSEFLPDGSFDTVLMYLNHYKIHILVTQKRKTILGNYKHVGISGNHSISVNGNLNKYEFLITFLHELAHLLTYEQHKNKVEPHGIEWKNFYSQLLIEFIQKNIFPIDIKVALQKSILNPAATANGETELLRILRRYNKQQNCNLILVESVPYLSEFITENGKIFKKGLKRRTRFECVELTTNKVYLFNALAEVKLLTKEN